MYSSFEQNFKPVRLIVSDYLGQRHVTVRPVSLDKTRFDALAKAGRLDSPMSTWHSGTAAKSGMYFYSELYRAPI